MFSLTALQAQVTIGSHFEPQKGSLLDLKENNQTGRNANSGKGMGLPRVALSSLTTLTVDDNSKGNDYRGLTVFNTTNNSYIKEGTYCWTGSTWEQLIVVDNKGAKDQILTSNGDGTYSWSIASFPDYQFHKPTHIATFDPSKVKSFNYLYSRVVNSPQGDNIYLPEPNLFKDHFVFTETVNVRTDASARKYILLGTTIHIRKNTRGDRVPQAGFWEEMKVEILIDNVAVKEYFRTYSTPAGASTTAYLDLFSVIPLTNIGKGSKTLQIRISNVRNTYSKNVGTTNGYFDSNNGNFLQIDLRDIGLVLYED